MPPVRACIFDAYGTLFDIAAPARRVAALPVGAPIAPIWEAFAESWRRKQLEYTWLRAITGRHADFRTVTEDALGWSFEAHGIAPEPALRDALMALYEAPDAFPEVAGMLDALAAAGVATAILSNGTPAMLGSAVAAAGIGARLGAILSVEAVGVFKPAPEVYRLGTAAFGLPAGQIAFVSANGWDAAGAADFGFRTIWVSRRGAPAERLPGRPAAVIGDLAGLPTILDGWRVAP